jgi:hypothetical protein
MSSLNQNIDEFGRDLSLKKDITEFMNWFERFKRMSWADIHYCMEEEEEREKIIAIKEKFRRLHEVRKELLKKGLYQLEEGEELDL